MNIARGIKPIHCFAIGLFFQLASVCQAQVQLGLDGSFAARPYFHPGVLQLSLNSRFSAGRYFIWQAHAGLVRFSWYSYTGITGGLAAGIKLNLHSRILNETSFLKLQDIFQMKQDGPGIAYYTSSHSLINKIKYELDFGKIGKSLWVFYMGTAAGLQKRLGVMKSFASPFFVFAPPKVWQLLFEINAGIRLMK